jgi:hypothetical protein
MQESFPLHLSCNLAATHAPMQDFAMPPRQRQHQEEAASSSYATCSLLDVVALGPVQELIWSALDSKDRQRLRETCRSLRDEVERSCNALMLMNRGEKMEAESLVKLSGRLPRVRTLHLSTAEAVQALSLDPPPSGEQHAFCMGHHRSSSILPLSRCVCPPSLPSCLQLMWSVSRGPGQQSLGPELPSSRSWRTCAWTCGLR